MTSHSHRATQATDATAQIEPRPATTTRSSGSSWPILLSAAFVLGGIALASLPAFLPQYAWIVKSLAKYGLTSGPFVVSGCVLFGVACMLRTKVPNPVPEPPTSDRDLILDELASELAQMRGGIQELRVEFVYLKDAQQSLLQACGDRDAAAQGEAQHAAIFRLAASLDQVGARLEQRLSSQHAALQASLSELNHGFQATWLQLASANGNVETRTAGTDGSNAEDGFDLEIPVGRAKGSDRSAHGRAVDDELDVWVELEEPSTAGSLGLLDTLDDPAQTQPSRTSASLCPSLGRKRPSAGPAHTQAEPAAPLPRSATSANAHEREGDRPDEAPVEGKLALLKSLLADARVRQALESMRHAER